MEKAIMVVAVSYTHLDKLKEFGGFAFLENIIDGYSNLNPARKARRNIFLTDEQWENERKALSLIHILIGGNSHKRMGRLWQRPFVSYEYSGQTDTTSDVPVPSVAMPQENKEDLPF